MSNNRRRHMQRLRSNQQRNRRVAFLHERTTISDNEDIKVQNEESNARDREQNVDGHKP